MRKICENSAGFDLDPGSRRRSPCTGMGVPARQCHGWLTGTWKAGSCLVKLESCITITRVPLAVLISTVLLLVALVLRTRCAATNLLPVCPCGQPRGDGALELAQPCCAGAARFRRDVLVEVCRSLPSQSPELRAGLSAPHSRGAAATGDRSSCRRRCVPRHTQICRTCALVLPPAPAALQVSLPDLI